MFVWSQIPSVLSETQYTLAVDGTGGLTFSQTRTVEVKSKTLSVFVQTDKAMYKPSQEGILIYSEILIFVIDRWLFYRIPLTRYKRPFRGPGEWIDQVCSSDFSTKWIGLDIWRAHYLGHGQFEDHDHTSASQSQKENIAKVVRWNW